jgi:hypothetical protein
MFWLKMILGLQDVRSEVSKNYKLGKIGQVLLSRKFWAAIWLLAGYALKQYKGVSIDTDHWLAVTMEVVGIVMQVFGLGLAGASISNSITVAPQEKTDERTVGESGQQTGIDKSF